MEYKRELPKNIEHYLATLSKLYGLEGNRSLQELLVNAQLRVKEDWSADNWNGGTYGHALFLMLPEQLFLHSIKEKFNLQNKIKEDLNKVHNVQNEFIEEVFLEMNPEKQSDWRRDSGLLLSGVRNVSEDATRRIWIGENSFRLFLSHKTEVKKETSDLKNRLEVYGISSFVAHEDIHPTKEWQEEIENALASMDGFAALLTPNFHESNWTDQEVGYAVARGVPMIAVKLGRDPYGFIGKFQALSTSWEHAAEDIAGVLISNERMFNVYLLALRKCSSFDEANLLARSIAKIKSLDHKQIDELVEVFNDNGELRGAYAFNGRKPASYGTGLIEHLHRIDSRRFTFTNEMRIQEVR